MMTEAEEKRLRGIEEAARHHVEVCGTPVGLRGTYHALFEALAPVEPPRLTEKELSFLGGHTGASGIPCCVSPTCHGSWPKAAARLRYLEAERGKR